MLLLKLKENHIMRTRILAVTTLAVLSGMAFAQTPKAEDDHSAHHPTGSDPAASPPATGATPSPEAFNQQMKAMQDMHQKLQAAKTPAERAKLMGDHMKLMQSGMTMMGQMHGVSAAGMGGMGGSAPGGMGMTPPSGTPAGGGQTSAGSAGGMPGMMGMHMQMERRMTMMEQMMQMMVDREAAMPRK